MTWGEEHQPKPLSLEAQKAAVELAEAVKDFEARRSVNNEDAMYLAQHRFEELRRG